MLACKSGVECQAPVTARPNDKAKHTCGSDFAYLYFCSFVFLSSFLVSFTKKIRIWNEENWIKLDVESICGGYYG
jgi:hypothetical protein